MSRPDVLLVTVDSLRRDALVWLHLMEVHFPWLPPGGSGAAERPGYLPPLLARLARFRALTDGHLAGAGAGAASWTSPPGDDGRDDEARRERPASLGYL